MYLTRKIHIVNPRRTLVQHIGKQKLKQTKKNSTKNHKCRQQQKGKIYQSLKVCNFL